MKITVRDVEVLKAIEPEQIRDYLFSSGWHEDRPFMDNATIWLKQEPERGEFEILLPNRKNLADYTSRISEVIEILADSENRSQVEILSELMTTAPNITIQGVVMQIQMPNTDKLSGEILLFGVVFEKLRKIRIKLSNHDYILAIKAYQERLPILCTGDLAKENHTFILKSPRNFTLDNI